MENFTRGLESMKKKNQMEILKLKITERAFLVVQWLRICLVCRDTGSIPGPGRSYMLWCS